jgi:glycosyltransferase involved in cell wall biosynthesis
MKTLIIAPFSPYPLVFGGAIRLYHLIKMFATISDVTVLAYNTWKDDGSSVQHLETICEKAILVDGAPLETQKKWQLQVRGTLGFKTFQYYSFYTKHFQQEIDAQLRQNKFDYIVAEQSQMGYFNCRQPGALHILDLQNIEYELLERRAQVQSNAFKRAALSLEAVKYKRQELDICRQFDVVFTPSERERDVLRKILPQQVECLPNSIDPDFFSLRNHEPTANEITFIGTTHVDANRDGLCYFMEHIFPLVKQRVPDVHFSIVGGKPPAEIREFGLRPDVEVTGFVDDVRPYMDRAKVLVVPLRSGGGTRLKILEGLSFGVPTVSTSIGAEGIDVRDGEHLLLGDTPEAFAQSIVRALQETKLQRHLKAKGRQLVEQHYSWQAVGKTLSTYLKAPESTADGWVASSISVR